MHTKYTTFTRGEEMGRKEKLLARLQTCPKNFTFEEMKNLLESLGFKCLIKEKQVAQG